MEYSSGAWKVSDLAMADCEAKIDANNPNFFLNNNYGKQALN